MIRQPLLDETRAGHFVHVDRMNPSADLLQQLVVDDTFDINDGDVRSRASAQLERLEAQIRISEPPPNERSVGAKIFSKAVPRPAYQRLGLRFLDRPRIPEFRADDLRAVACFGHNGGIPR